MALQIPPHSHYMRVYKVQAATSGAPSVDVFGPGPVNSTNMAATASWKPGATTQVCHTETIRNAVQQHQHLPDKDKLTKPHPYPRPSQNSCNTNERLQTQLNNMPAYLPITYCIGVSSHNYPLRPH